MAWKFVFILLVSILASIAWAQQSQCYSCSSIEYSTNSRQKRGFFDDIWNQVSNSLKEAFTNTINQLKNTLDDAIEQLKNSGSQISEDLRNRLQIGLNDLWTEVKENPDLIHLQQATDTMRKFYDLAHDQSKEIFTDDMKAKFQDLLNEFKERAPSPQTFLEELGKVGVLPQALRSSATCGSEFDEASIGTCNRAAGDKCAKIAVQIGSSTTYARSCVSPIVCNTQGYHCCDGDRCNSAINHRSLPTLAMITLLFGTLFLNYLIRI